MVSVGNPNGSAYLRIGGRAVIRNPEQIGGCSGGGAQLRSEMPRVPSLAPTATALRSWSCNREGQAPVYRGRWQAFLLDGSEREVLLGPGERPIRAASV